MKAMAVKGAAMGKNGPMDTAADQTFLLSLVRRLVCCMVS